MSGFRTLIAGLAFLLAVFAVTPAIVFVRAQDRTTMTPGKRPEYPRFEADVLVNGDPLQEYYVREHRFVKALRGEEYEIRLRNRSDDRVAVALFVDGLNTIDATRGGTAWDASKWLIEPRQTITIKGWQMSSEHARRFYFTDEPDSYAAKLGVRGTHGVIWAVFFRERRPQIIVPPPRRKGDISREERQTTADGPAAGAKSQARNDAATGIGRSVRHDVRWVDLDLESRPAAEVTIRYNYPSIYAPDPRYIVPGKRDN